MSDITELDARFGDSGARVARTQHAAGQATQVEQARAIAEVRAAVMIAMDRPRNRNDAIAEMREVCGITALADRAFFRVKRGGEHVNGESIHLARELARCWGNLTYGVKELARDDGAGQSELLAFAWDLQTNARSEITFIIPHFRGSGEKRKRLLGTQEIYENNASFAGRRLREAIFSVLPVWFKDEAADICHKTLESGGGKPLVQRIADLRAAFEGLGVTVKQLEEKRGRKIDNFLPEDVGALRVIYGSLKRGEVTIADEFPSGEPEPRPTGSKLDALEHIAASEPPTNSPAGAVHAEGPHGAVSMPAGDTHSSGASAEPVTGDDEGQVAAVGRTARATRATGAPHSPAGNGHNGNHADQSSNTGKDAVAAGASGPAVGKLHQGEPNAMPAGDQIDDLLGGRPRKPAGYYHVTLADNPNSDDWDSWHGAITSMIGNDPHDAILRDNRTNLEIFGQFDKRHHALMRKLEAR